MRVGAKTLVRKEEVRVKLKVLLSALCFFWVKDMFYEMVKISKIAMDFF